VDILEVAENRGMGGIDAMEVTKSELVFGHDVPDGRPYTLRYSYKGKNYNLPNLRLEEGCCWRVNPSWRYSPQVV
jgi:hypothetical protein